MNDGIAVTVIRKARRDDPKINSKSFTNSVDMVLVVYNWGLSYHHMKALKTQSINTFDSINLAGLPRTTVIMSFPVLFSAIAVRHRPALSVFPVFRPLIFR